MNPAFKKHNCTWKYMCTHRYTLHVLPVQQHATVRSITPLRVLLGTPIQCRMESAPSFPSRSIKRMNSASRCLFSTTKQVRGTFKLEQRKADEILTLTSFVTLLRQKRSRPHFCSAAKYFTSQVTLVFLEKNTREQRFQGSKRFKVWTHGKTYQ